MDHAVMRFVEIAVVICVGGHGAVFEAGIDQGPFGESGEEEFVHHRLGLFPGGLPVLLRESILQPGSQHASREQFYLFRLHL